MEMGRGSVPFCFSSRLCPLLLLEILPSSVNTIITPCNQSANMTMMTIGIQLLDETSQGDCWKKLFAQRQSSPLFRAGFVEDSRDPGARMERWQRPILGGSGVQRGAEVVHNNHLLPAFLWLPSSVARSPMCRKDFSPRRLDSRYRGHHFQRYSQRGKNYKLPYPTLETFP